MYLIEYYLYMSTFCIEKANRFRQQGETELMNFYKNASYGYKAKAYKIKIE